MTDRLTGRVALISGAASGMGAAHARAFVAEGASASPRKSAPCSSSWPVTNPATAPARNSWWTTA